MTTLFFSNRSRKEKGLNNAPLSDCLVSGTVFHPRLDWVFEKSEGALLLCFVSSKLIKSLFNNVPEMFSE